MNAFRHDDTRYHVVLTGESNHYLSLNTKDGTYVELMGVSRREQRPLFQLLNGSGMFRGQVLFPSRLKKNEQQRQVWGNLMVDFESLNLIPNTTGFKAVVVDRDSREHGLVVSTDEELIPKDVFTKKLQRLINRDGVNRTSDSAALFLGDDYHSLALLDLNDGKTIRYELSHPRDAGLAASNREDTVCAISNEQEQFLLILQKSTITRFDRTIKRSSLPEGLVHGRGASCCAVNDGTMLAGWLMKGDKGELHLFDTATLQSVDHIPFGQYSNSRITVASAENVLIMRVEGGPFMVFDCSENSLTLIGRSSPLLHHLESCEDWTVSDDGQKIFFIGNPTNIYQKFAIGEVNVSALTATSHEEAVTVPSGLAAMKQDDISFDDLPAGAGKELVGVLKEDITWKEFSPDDRWLLGNGSGGFLYHTGTRQTHRIASHAVQSAFSRDSQRIVLKNVNGWQIWDLKGNVPALLVATDPYDQSLRAIDRLLDGMFHLHISESRVLAVSELGSVIFKYDSNAMQIEFEAPMKGELSSVSDDWSKINVCKSDGSVWRYELDDVRENGVSKSVLPEFVYQSRPLSLGRNGNYVLAQSSRDIHTWHADGNSFSKPITLHDDRGSLCSVSPNGQWIALKHRRDGRSTLLLFNEYLQEQASLQLQMSDFMTPVLANDGRHVLVQPSGGEKSSYVLRMR